ncbi:site-specific integrase [Salmonella enterica subsp. enterica serovar Glostrup]|uniref:Tyrosine-type recombinase/integrase n=1 Tax=Salmonella enterica TaxID=28901 RepID=A0A5U4SI33_SALER|nr:site-specific integrase [Salmonella enterica subsp. enterica serovar Aba]EAB5770319.1 site-specific integrase [Salmonella enterica subsp. enterica serovar Warnow]EAP9251431.1 site-specific integrase [Salmonella enterica]EBS3650669.1 site-specific integrase [Salmonella enterica subsp. enterica serovar Glostrup]EBX7380524.1 site-specific integrase [Salmonella enterica subsp. enterica serovar Takoradi]EDS6600593.1 tyrosine-type recombinase/integrase [Salmonella enterica subsp. enterica]
MNRTALRQVVSVVQTTVFDAYIGGLAPSGRRGITSLLNRSARILKRGAYAADYPWEQLNYAAVAKVRAALLDDGYAVSSVNMALSALRGVAQTAFNLNCMDAETLARIRSVKRVSGDIQRKGRALDKQEIRALIQAAKQHPQPVRRYRDAAIVLTLCGTGLRVGELVKLELRDYDNGILTVRQGKGRKYREIHVADAVDKAIRAWVKVSANEAENALFSRIQRNGKTSTQPLTTTGLTGILAELQQTAGIARFTPHDMRRTFITRLLEQGVDINTVRQLAGHSDISTTTRYDCRGESMKISASKHIKCF